MRAGRPRDDGPLHSGGAVDRRAPSGWPPVDCPAHRRYARPVPRLVRLALQVVLFLLLLSVVVGLASADTGLLEKGMLAVLAGVIIWLASLVRRLAARPTSHSA